MQNVDFLMTRLKCLNTISMFFVDYNECFDIVNPCLNGGVCENRDGSYHCLCPDGWTGPVCADGKLSLFPLFSSHSLPLHLSPLRRHAHALCRDS